MPESQKKTPSVVGALSELVGAYAESVKTYGYGSLTDILSGNASGRLNIRRMENELLQLKIQQAGEEAKAQAARDAALPQMQGNAGQLTGLPPTMFQGLQPEQLGSIISNTISSNVSLGNQKALAEHKDTLSDENEKVRVGNERSLIGARRASDLSADATKRQRDEDERQRATGLLTDYLGNPTLAGAITANPTVANTVLQMEQKSSGDKAAYASLQRMLPELEKTNPAQAAIVKEQLMGVANIGFGSGTYESLLADTQDTAFPKSSKVETMDMTNSVLTTAQQGIIDATEVIANLNDMKMLATPEMFTTLATVESMGEEVLQRLAPQERQAFYDQRDQLVAMSTDTLSQILYKRSGAAVTPSEEARAKNVVPGTGDSHARFMAKWAAMERGQQRKRSLYLRLVTEGLSLETLKSEEEKNNRILLGELEKIHASGDDRMSPAAVMPTQDEWNSMTAEEKVRRWKESQGGGESAPAVQ